MRGCLGDLFLRHDAFHRAALLRRRRFAIGACQARPYVREHRIVRNSEPLGEKIGEIILRQTEALLGRLAIQRRRPRRILRHALPFFVAHAKAVLRRRIALCGRLQKQRRRLLIILRHAHAPDVHRAQVKLRRRFALCGGFAKQRKCLRKIFARVGLFGVFKIARDGLRTCEGTKHGDCGQDNTKNRS